MHEDLFTGELDSWVSGNNGKLGFPTWKVECFMYGTWNQINGGELVEMEVVDEDPERGLGFKE